MTADLVTVARRIVERGRPGEEIEGFLVHQRDFYVKAFEGEVEALSSAEPRGASARIVKDGRAGFAFTTDLSDDGLDDLVARARDNASYATPDEAAGLPAPADGYADVAGLFDEGHPGVPPADKVAFAVDLERATRASDPRIRTVEEAVYADSASEVAIATSRGLQGSYRRTDAWCYSIAIATDGDDTETGFEFDLGRGIDALDRDDVARRAAERAVRVLGAKKIASRKLPVVFDPYTAAQFLAVLGRVLTGEAVQKGRSLFAGKLGEQVAADGITLVDDGSAEGAPAAAPWDGEGVATGCTQVIRDGRLESFLYDTVTGRREGRTSTGNAGRAGFKSAPGPAPSNMAIDPTGESAGDVLQRAGRALLVQDLHGVHSGANPISGDFSVGVTGRLYEGGSPGMPVKGITIALPMLDILKGIEAVADDRRWLPFGGSFAGATTLVAEMTVAGE